MGRMLIAEVVGTTGAMLAGGTAQAATLQGQDLGSLAGLAPLGVTVGNDAVALVQASDVVIDFTAPAVTVRLAALAAEAGKALVVGTTGLDPAQTAAIQAAARQAPIVWSANMSLGVNLLLGLVEQAAARLGPDYDIEVLEMHHRMKVDAPSGTALALGHAAAAGRQVPLDEVWVKSRDGHTGARASGTIGFATLRGGDVVGDHTVMFAGLGERVELGHKASDRRIYARGAVRAALWVKGRPPGLYGMKDVLGL
ncbi:4-hydroxy-tetrahydrodipicolinate reductase [Aliidongia dinghuensis]|uniref:4-hydroxy-tetrahydrodipicolinate reductase n=2 Tax=Aliidongia dinghuensis TaxID=1867774 RepID=A0A8J2YX42_9PROT|nr:4-hydroxy-tetrahydrodipicolinate reductase [Aliidongia dinghuensis]